ncbi:MAG: CbtA family protein [Spongiibacteraceae bacterium]|nr:CbtA family protein [Spongiibacteraceae bacterium]
MLFRQIVFSALCVGLLSGLLLTAVQQLHLTPIIFSAEQYESPEPQVSGHHHQAHDHHHDTEVWSPADGTERLAYSTLSNILAGIGFAILLLALMSQLQPSGLTTLTPVKGLAWGVAGFIAFFVAPGLGLPPEIPGIEAAPVSSRQTWWILTVLATAVGIALLFFVPKNLKVIGCIFIVVPHLIGAPLTNGPEFSQTDPAVVAVLSQLHQQFILVSGACNLIFWIALGFGSAIVLERWVLKNVGLTR